MHKKKFINNKITKEEKKLHKKDWKIRVKPRANSKQVEIDYRKKNDTR